MWLIAVKNEKMMILVFVAILFCIVGCISGKYSDLSVRGGNFLTYSCENNDLIAARYYSLSDNSLNFVKLTMPDGKEYTLPQALSASGARYTNDLELVWWIKGDAATVEIRSREGDWQLKYNNCQVVRITK